MDDRLQKIAAEVVKVAAILLACFIWFDARLEESTHQVASATTSDLRRAKNETEARIESIERTQREASEILAATHGEVREVEAGLREEHEVRLRTEREQILSLLDGRSQEMRALIEQGLARIDDAALTATADIHSRVDTLATSIQRQPALMKRRMIYPVVQLRGNGTVGSGVVVRSEPRNAEGVSETFVLTAHHVVQEVMGPDAEDRQVVEDLRFLDPDSDRLDVLSWRAHILAEDPDHDLALLRVDRDEPWPYVAELATRSEFNALEIFDSVYAVGCPLGNKPLPSLGEISSQEKRVAGTNFWMVNAPTFFGNSGGGIFHLESGRLVGISSMIYTYGKRQPMVVPHMGLFVPLETARVWLEASGYAYFFGDDAPGDSAVSRSAATIED